MISNKNNPKKSLYTINGSMPIFSTNAKNNLIVRNANIIDTKNPTIKCVILNAISSFCISIRSKTRAPRIVGIPSIKENFVASFMFIPINNAAVIAVPDRDAPGIRAKHWKIPIKRAP